jgi:hypothetical protein
MKKLFLLCSVLASVVLPIFQATAATSTMYCTVQSGGVATTFTISSAVLPFSPINPSYTGGSITFTVTDNDGDGALLTASSGSALLDCLINGTSYHRLGSDPYSLSVPPDGSTTVTLDFGTPIPSLGRPHQKSRHPWNLSSAHMTGFRRRRFSPSMPCPLPQCRTEARQGPC